eukprot:TRINITY_DN20723_c0_g1_i8.p1 TRINITY_DN20723_c0_g1~~TRINITY_DN20723_c0_g1_i8.p1  ORF type:complete len:179 (-),score=30.05 TRINITY_DN20723_c0_g1_i8:2-538(-)
MHGYGDPYIHAFEKSKCLKMLESVRIDEVLQVEDENLFIGAIKITVNGWEGHILESMEQILREKTPKSVFITFSYVLLEASGYEDPKNVLHYMHALGYHQIAYSGLNCTTLSQSNNNNSDQNSQIVQEKEQKMNSEESTSTWCWLQHALFDDFIERTKIRSSQIFNLLFIWGDKQGQM